MTTKTKKKAAKPNLKSLILKHGSHNRREDGMCVMEAAAYIANEPHSASPKCVCPVITTFMINWNDSLPSDAERARLLKPFLPKIIRTKATPEIEKKRSLKALDWLIRTFTPAWLDLVPACKASAAALRGLAEIVDEVSAAAAREPVLAAQKEANAAWAAARAAAGAAAGDAARAAAWDAVWAAAGDAAGAAAGDAAGDAAKKALAPTVTTLQSSAGDLLKRMISTK